MIEDIIGQVYDQDRTLGTCFLVNERYAFTAKHVTDKKENSTYNNIVTCKFKVIDKKISANIIYNDNENDFVILKLSEEVTSKFYRISREVVEVEDKYDSCGYYTMDEDSIKFKGEVIEEIEKSRYKIDIKNQVECARWQGVSGAPVIIENCILGMVLEQETGGNFMPTLEFVGMHAIIDKIMNTNPYVLNDMHIGYHPYLTERMKALSIKCREEFYISSEKKENLISHYYIFKNSKESTKRMGSILINYLHDYGVELLLDEQYENADRREKREVERVVRQRIKKVLELIKNSNHIIHMFIWILMEGGFEYPRIGSSRCILNSNVKSDIYIDETNKIKLSIANGNFDSEIINNVQECIGQLDKYIESCNSGNILFVPDQLAFESLNIINQEKIQSLFDSGNSEDIELSIVIVSVFNYDGENYADLSDNNKMRVVKKHVSSFEKEFRSYLYNTKHINKMKISWIFIPFKNINAIKEYLVNNYE